MTVADAGRVGLARGLERVTLVLLGSGAYLALGLGAQLIVVNALSPEAFSAFAVSVAVTTLLQELCGSGVDEAVVRYAAPRAGTDDARALAIFRAAWRLKLGVNVAIAGVAWAIAAPVSAWLGRGDALVAPLRTAAVAGVGAAAFGVVLAVPQAWRQFGAYAWVRPLASGVKLALLAALWVAGAVTLTSVLWASALSFFVAVALAPLFVSVAFLRAPAVPQFHPTRDLVRFAGWLVLAKALFAAYTRVDLLLLERLAGPHDVAAYAVAGQLLFLLDLTTFSVIVSLLPEASRIHDRASAWRYARSAAAQCLALAVAFLAFYVLAGPIVALLFGGRYPEAAGLLRILFWGALATLMVHPLYLLFYARERPEWVVAVNLVQTVVCGVACWWLIPTWGAAGAAAASLGARLCGCVVVLVGVARALSLFAAAPPVAARSAGGVA
jgi:O-antigen/teichoic acid export membrane protein